MQRHRWEHYINSHDGDAPAPKTQTKTSRSNPSQIFFRKNESIHMEWISYLIQTVNRNALLWTVDSLPDRWQNTSYHGVHGQQLPFHQLQRSWQKCSISHSCVPCMSSDTANRPNNSTALSRSIYSSRLLCDRQTDRRLHSTAVSQFLSCPKVLHSLTN